MEEAFIQSEGKVQSAPALELPGNRSQWTTLPQVPKHIHAQFKHNHKLQPVLEHELDFNLHLI